MLVTASTVKDSAENLAFFVQANLAAGADHLMVFLDAPRADGQAEAAALLDEHPQVTCVRAGGPGWWQGERPANLNHRQRINANWAKSVLAAAGVDGWILHIDGDEVLRVDTALLDGLDASVRSIRLSPLEAVAQVGATQRATLFKRALDDDDLNLLHVLGAIDAPSNQAYFHGHLMGKSGVRVSSDLSLTLHDAVDPDGRRVDGLAHPDLTLLHYDAPTDREFIRKWTALAGAGPARYRAERRASAAALRSLAGRNLPAAVREKYLRRIYAAHIADDVELLADLGMLLEHDPLTPAAPPAGGLSESELAAVAACASAQRERPKASFLARDSAKDGAKDGAKDRGKAGAAAGSSGRARRRTGWGRRS